MKPGRKMTKEECEEVEKSFQDILDSIKNLKK